MPNASFDNVTQAALAIARDPQARVVFHGAKAPEARSLWGQLNLKCKIFIFSAGLVFGAQSIHGLVEHAQGSVPQAQGQALNSQHSPNLHSSPSQDLNTAQPAPLSPRMARLNQIEQALPSQGAGLDSSQIASALLKIDPFISIITAIEDFKAKPYYDSGGLNVGMGYCVTKRLAEYGSARVSADLASAGFSPEDASALIKNNKTTLARIKISPLQGTLLIDAVHRDYTERVENALGKDIFDRMPTHQKAAIEALAYNTADVGKFTKLMAALRHGDNSKAMLNMRTNWFDASGELHANHRHRAYLQAMFLGTNSFKLALKDSSAFESQMASPSSESALADIASVAQNPDGVKAKILSKRLQSTLPWAFHALQAVQAGQPKAPASKGL